MMMTTAEEAHAPQLSATQTRIDNTELWDGNTTGVRIAAAKRKYRTTNYPYPRRFALTKIYPPTEAGAIARAHKRRSAQAQEATWLVR